MNEVFTLQFNQIEDPRHSWDPDSHFRFASIYKQYIERGKPRERYMERLAIEFPKLGRNALEKHDKIVESFRWNQKHRKNITKDWERHRNALRQAAENLLEQLMDQAIEKFNKEIEFVKQEKQQKRIHQEIDDKKDDYIQRLEEKEKIKAETELKKQQELTKKEQDRAMRAQKAKNTATVYKTTKNSMGEMERKRLQQEAMQKQKKLQEDIRRNKNKVSERQAIQEQKILERIEDNELQQRAKEEEELRIAKAVSQYPHIPKVEVDHERVKQATKSNEAKKNQFDKSDKVNLFPQTGFTVDNLMKDMRYRLSHVLNEAGLQNTEYGKRVLQAAPHILPRKDTVTTHNFK